MKNLEEIKPKNEKLEKVVNNYFYEKEFDNWVQNFASNLNNIWKESSAKELVPKDTTYKKEEHSAIVIGAGPSIKKHRHLELLAQSEYRGSVVCSDRSLEGALRAGVTPDKFPKYYVITIDPFEAIRKYYDYKIVDKYGSKINGIFSTFVKPSVADRARKAKIKIHWLHTLFDYNEGRKSFNRLTALMVRTKNQSHRLPAIQTGGNVGTSAWFISWQILKCGTIALIGLNHGWEDDDPLDLIISHGNVGDISKINRDSKTFKKLFPKIYNPEFKKYCILDPIFSYYSSAFKEFILRSPSDVTTINATEGGSIFGERITCIKFEKFLSLFSK